MSQAFFFSELKDFKYNLCTLYLGSELFSSTHAANLNLHLPSYSLSISFRSTVTMFVGSVLQELSENIELLLQSRDEYTRKASSPCLLFNFV